MLRIVHDCHEQVNEFYGDYVAVNEDLFTLNIDKSLVLTGPSGNSLETLSMFNQSVQGILAMLLSMKVEPSQIRYQGRSQVRSPSSLSASGRADTLRASPAHLV